MKVNINRTTTLTLPLSLGKTNLGVPIRPHVSLDSLMGALFPGRNPKVTPSLIINTAVPNWPLIAEYRGDGTIKNEPGISLCDRAGDKQLFVVDEMTCTIGCTVTVLDTSDPTFSMDVTGAFLGNNAIRGHAVPVLEQTPIFPVADLATVPMSTSLGGSATKLSASVLGGYYGISTIFSRSTALSAPTRYLDMFYLSAAAPHNPIQFLAPLGNWLGSSGSRYILIRTVAVLQSVLELDDRFIRNAVANDDVYWLLPASVSSAAAYDHAGLASGFNGQVYASIADNALGSIIVPMEQLRQSQEVSHSLTSGPEITNSVIQLVTQISADDGNTTAYNPTISHTYGVSTRGNKLLGVKRPSNPVITDENSVSPL